MTSEPTPSPLQSRSEFKMDDLPEEVRNQVQALIEEHGADNLGTLSIEKDDNGDVVVRRVEEEPSMRFSDRHPGLMSHTITSAALALTQREIAAANKRMMEARRRRIEAEDRMAERASLREQVLKDNYNTALNLIQDAGRRLRWTQISARLNPLALQGVKASLKQHPNIIFTKKDKRVFVQWKEIQ